MPSPTAVHQLLPSFARRDAIGNHAVLVRDTLRGLGYRSDIFAAAAVGDAHHDAHPVGELPDDGWLIYQLSIGHPVAARYVDHRGGRIVDYHNVTPEELFAPWAPEVGAELAAGRRQVGELAPVTDLAFAVSDHNRAELDAAGYRHTVTRPILFDPASLHHEADRRVVRALARRRRRQGTQVLFVGRVAPNKAQHDLIAAIDAHRRAFDPDVHLHLVGGSSSQRYDRALRLLVERTGLADHVTFHGSVTDGALAAHYVNADVYCCLSDHEGFGVPLLEAMANDVPIVTHAAAALPETAGDAAVVLADKAPHVVATALHRVATDGGLRAELVARGRVRLAHFSLDRTRRVFAEAIEQTVGPAGG